MAKAKAKDAEAAEPLPPQDKLDEKLTLARLAALYAWPYTAPALTRLTFRWVPEDSPLDSIAVDKYWRAYVNPRFVHALTIGELALVIAGHELQHLLGGHSVRMPQYAGYMLSSKGRPIELRNVAGDLAINDLLPEWIESANEWMRVLGRPQIPFKIPDHGTFVKDFKDADGKPFPPKEAAETYADLIYALAQKNGPDPEGQGMQGPPGLGEGKCKCQCGTGAGQDPANTPWEDRTPADPRDTSTGVTPEEAQGIGRQVAEKIQEQVKKSQGSVPAGMRFWAEVTLAPPKVPWQQIVRKLVRTGWTVVAGRRFRSYTKPNRRTAGQSRVIFPGHFTTRPKLLVVLDTSGSMGLNDYQAAFGEIQAVLSQNLTGEANVPVIACDAQTSPVQYVRRLKDLKLIGGGGTDMTLGIEVAAKTKVGKDRKLPALVIVMTDGFTGWPATPPRNCKVLAVLTNRQGTPPPAWIQYCYACDE